MGAVFIATTPIRMSSPFDPINQGFVIMALMGFLLIFLALVTAAAPDLIKAEEAKRPPLLQIPLIGLFLEELISVLPQVTAALAPQPGVLGNNPIILAGTQDGDHGDPTKLLLATSGLTLLTKLLQSPMVTSWGQQLVKTLDSEAPLDQSRVVKFLKDNPQFLRQLRTPKSEG